MRSFEKNEYECSFLKELSKHYKALLVSGFKFSSLVGICKVIRYNGCGKFHVTCHSFNRNQNIISRSIVI